MDLQIKVFKSPAKMDKPVFRETVLNLEDSFPYEKFVDVFKHIYGNYTIIQFNII